MCCSYRFACCKANKVGDDDTQNFPKSELYRLHKKYPKGLRVKALYLWNEKASASGTLGTVIGVDSAGTIMVHWDTGVSIGVIYGIDRIQIL